MTNNLKCPFCGAELESVKLQSEKINMGCPQCKMWGINKIWKLAIDGKKAQDALNKIWHSPNEKPAPFCTIITEDGEWYWDTNGYYQGDDRWKNDTPWAYLQDVVDLIEITSITKQEE